MRLNSLKSFQRIRHVPLRHANERKLKEISSKGMLSLSLVEMKTIQSYFKKAGREPTEAELETLAQTWSEHCSHKTFKARIFYREGTENQSQGKSRTYNNLLQDTIMAVTDEMKKPWCLSTFKDNAGVIAFDESTALCIKVETHNHPSALEPYGGAGTGIGGVIRDILGCGLGGKPVLTTDVFAFGPPDLPDENLPHGVMHPKRTLKGVVAGVRDYGNRMGIPTASGAVIFGEGFIQNPLVFCGCVGLIPNDKIRKSVQSGDLIVTVGGRTGRDGIHGATFSSAELSAGIESSVVQIGHAVMEKKMMDALLQARDLGYYRCITDCGAGGFSSAIGEMGEKTGARVQLDKAPLKYQGLKPWEIWISESQERMILSVPSKHWLRLRDLFEKENVEATAIGEFTRDERLHVFYHDDTVVDLPMSFLHDERPQLELKATWKPQLSSNIKIKTRAQAHSLTLRKILSHPTVASKEWIVRQYDHEVQGGTVIKPFTGPYHDGPSDACVFRPNLNSWKGAVVSHGINPLYGRLDPYWMAACAIDEALRNLIAVGGTLDHTALIDNFCWGDCQNEEQLAGLVRASQACYNIAQTFGVPFISGKDSLNNTWRGRDKKLHSIPGTLLITALGVINDIRRCKTMDLKDTGNLVYILGSTREELGGSHYELMTRIQSEEVPRVHAESARETMQALTRAIHDGYVMSVHDLSEGGLSVATAEMVIAGNIGIELDLSRVPTIPEKISPESLLFSESPSRFIVELHPRYASRFESLFRDLAFAHVGKTIKKPILRIFHGKKKLIQEHIDSMRKAWKYGLSQYL